MQHAAVLLLILILAFALRGRGLTFHWWVLPTALALHWWLWNGLGREPWFIASVAAFLFAVTVSAWKRRNPVPIASLPPMGSGAPRPAAMRPPASPPAEHGAPSSGDADAPRHGRTGRVIDRTTPPPPPRVVADATTLHAELMRASATRRPGAVAPEALSAESQRRSSDLLASLIPEASPRQRSELWPQLRGALERVARPIGSPARVVAYAAEGTWGARTVPGLRLEWDALEAPGGTTVLVLRCEGAGLPDGRRSALVLVPTSLPGVKRLAATGVARGEEASELWAGRGVFVPVHLVLGAE